MRKLIGVLAVVFGAFGCLSDVRADHAHHSPAKVVLATLTGATIEGENERGQTYRIAYTKGGSATITLNGKTETGTWSVDKGGHYCEVWPTVFGGVKRCGGIEVTGPLLIFRGKFKTTRTVISPGG